jgi:hypothetical protein
MDGIEPAQLDLQASFAQLVVEALQQRSYRRLGRARRICLDRAEHRAGPGEALCQRARRPWVLRAGAVHPWEPPASHPLAGRIAALETELERRRKDSAANAGAFAQAARYVAPESKA